MAAIVVKGHTPTRRQRQVAANALLYALMLFLCLVMLFPIAWGFLTSIKPNREIFKLPITWLPLRPTLQNYRNVIDRTDLPRYFANSAVVAVFAILATVLFAVPAAYGFARYEFRLKNVLFIAILGTQMIPGLTNIIPLYLMMSKLGLLNSLFSLILVYGGQGLPLGIWLLRSFIVAVPRELDDAATIDGCSRWGVLARVILPLSKPGLAATSILLFVGAWNEFVLALIFISRDAMRTLPLALYRFVGTYGEVEWGNLMAMGMLIMVPTVLFFLLLQRQFISGLLSGAVKG